MKLLHVIPSVNPVGGGPIEGLRQLRGPLAACGVQMDVCCCDPPDAPYVRDSELNPVALGPSLLKYAFNTRMISWLRRNCTEYDAVIIEGLWQFHSIAVWLALLGKRVPYFVFPHGMLDPWFKRRYPLKHIKKSLYWLLGDYWVLRHARAVLFTSSEEKLLARQSFHFYRCREEVTSYGTASPPTGRERLSELFLAEFPALKGRRLLLFIGRIHEKKGCDLLVKAFAREAGSDQSLHLVMAGPYDAAMRARLDEIIVREGLQGRVTWTGMLSGDLKWGAFHAAEAFCLPSHQENFGVAVVEALGCGVPVLISDKVNIWREIVEDGAGLAGEDTEGGTANVLRRWLATGDEERARMRASALVCFNRRYQSQQVAKRLVNLIRDEVDATNRPGRP